MKTKRVLVTGGAGFIGSHTCDFLLKENYDVIILDSLSEKTHYKNEFPYYIDDKVEKVHGNVLDENLMLNLLKRVDYIIHLAAEMDLNPDFSKFINVNTRATALIFELIVKNQLSIKKVVIASTQFVYGDGKWECDTHGEFIASSRNIEDLRNGIWDYRCPKCFKLSKPIENTEIFQNPPNHYALSKYFQEMIGIKLGRLYSIPTTCLRYSIVHGPRQSLKNTYSGALRSFAICLSNNIKIPTYEDNKSLRDFVSVYDVARANVFMLENEESNFEVYNIGGEEYLSVYDLAEIISDKLNTKLEFNKLQEYRVGDVRHTISSISKLKSLGFEYVSNEHEAIEQYLKWFKTQTVDIGRFKETQKRIREIGIIKVLS